MIHTQQPAFKNPFVIRQEQLVKTLRSSGFSSVAINPGPTLKYLTGLSFHLMERPVVVFFSPGQPPSIVLPELEMGKLADLHYPIQPFPYGENPATWSAAFKQAALASRIDDTRVGIEPRQLRVLELRFLESAAPDAQFVSGEACLGTVRLRKDPTELKAMRKAVEIAQKALLATLPVVKPGISERNIAAELTAQLLRNGSDPEFPFSPIVSCGPNSANPHATPTDRILADSDLLVIDWGATYDGYISDLTRTFTIGKAEDEFKTIARIVAEANAVGRAIARPGIHAGEVDQAARSVINHAGYGEQFFHRTGHGIGMEGHEEPYIFAESSQVLAPGMTFTIEPGIYLTGRGGVRIEDNIAITVDGNECLTSLPREVTDPVSYLALAEK